VGVQPFAIEVAQATLADLDERLAHVRWPRGHLRGAEWLDGPDPAYLRSLTAYWRRGFDWRAQEELLNRFHHVRVQLDGHHVHAVYERGRGPRPLPLVLTHGWPSTFAEFRHVIGPLSDPAAYGGDAADAFDVVVPSLPGFAFSDPLPPGGWSTVPALWTRLMRRLGHERFGAHGGDIGGFVTNRLAIEFPDRLLGVHVHYPAEPHLADDVALSTEEQAFVAERPRAREVGGAYAHVHRSRPLTLAYGLADSPAGLAAWIADKWWEWTDHDGDLEDAVTRDDLLTALTLYWATETAESSLQVYREWGLGVAPEHGLDLYPATPAGVEPRPLPAGRPIAVPAGIAVCHLRYPRRFVERAYADIRQWTELPKHGHFPALEQPDALVRDIRSFFRSVR
jgi:pimeloyl-ACP methyl ester carboxylesterase